VLITEVLTLWLYLKLYPTTAGPQPVRD